MKRYNLIQHRYRLLGNLGRMGGEEKSLKQQIQLKKIKDFTFLVKVKRKDNKQDRGDCQFLIKNDLWKQNCIQMWRGAENWIRIGPKSTKQSLLGTGQTFR